MPNLLLFIVVSACLGALIGLIRQWDEQAEEQPGDFAGVRTHTLWAVLGCLSAFASEAHVPFVFPVVLVLIAAHLIAQVATAHDRSNPGSTSVAGALLTMFCGALVFWEELKSAVVVAATTMVIVGLKRPIHAWTRTINPQDIRATLQFVAVTGVILPLVPNRDMGPFQGFNPFSTWLMVVLISGLGFAGYLAMRIVGSRAGVLLTAILGGIASSTASSLAFSRRSREEPGASDHYALAVVAACTVMLPRVIVAIGIINRAFALTLIVPFAIMAVPGVCYALWIVLRHRAENAREPEAPRLGNPLSLSTAIKFAVLYAVIAFLVKMVRELGWTEGMLPLSFISGLTDMDAISLSIAREQGSGETTPGLATRAVVLAAVSNTLLKAGMAIAIGSRGLKTRVGIVLGATAAVGIAWILLGGLLPA